MEKFQPERCTKSAPNSSGRPPHKNLKECLEKCDNIYPPRQYQNLIYSKIGAPFLPVVPFDVNQLTNIYITEYPSIPQIA